MNTKDDAEFEVRGLPTVPVTRENFAPFGDLIEPVASDDPYGERDARLDLTQGTPRFYIMDEPAPGDSFGHITRHRSTTQCLASSCGSPWFIAVAPPYDLDVADAEPALEDIRGFIIPGHVSVMFHKGTWHAGPYFTRPSHIRFFNLELSDTNVADHHSSYLTKRFGLKLKFQPEHGDEIPGEQA